MRTWNPIWLDVVRAIDREYVNNIRSMIIAAINWVERNPTAYPTWRENPFVDVRQRWDHMFEPTNDHAEQWFAVITAACHNDYPSVLMMNLALAAGMKVRKEGWNTFDADMLAPDTPHGR